MCPLNGLHFKNKIQNGPIFVVLFKKAITLVAVNCTKLEKLVKLKIKCEKKYEKAGSELYKVLLIFFFQKSDPHSGCNFVTISAKLNLQ